MGWWWKAILAVFVLIDGLGAVLVPRTLSYAPLATTSEPAASPALPSPPPVDPSAVAMRAGQAITFPTITLQPGDPRPGQEGPWLALHDWLGATYPRAHAAMGREVVPGTLTLLYTWPGTDPALPPLLFMAHQDVVPVNLGTAQDWTAPPFSGAVVDGFLYGRGAIDNKVSLVALMEAAEALLAQGFQPRRTVMFLFGHDEEVSGTGAQAAVALLQARGIRPAMVLDEGFMVIDPNPLTGKPMGMIGVAEKGYLSLTLTATAQGGHSAAPPRNSAPVRLARALVALEENPMPAHLGHPIVAGMFRAASADLPLSARVTLANLWLLGPVLERRMQSDPAADAVIRTTIAPTMLTGSAKENVLAQSASAVVNFRVHSGDTPEAVRDHVTRLVAPFDITVEARQGVRGAAASPVSPTEGPVWDALAAVAARTGEGAPVAPGLVLGATDARFASAISDHVYRFAPIVLSPRDLSGFHGTNERLSLENIRLMVEGYAILMMALAGA